MHLTFIYLSFTHGHDSNRASETVEVEQGQLDLVGVSVGRRRVKVSIEGHINKVLKWILHGFTHRDAPGQDAEDDKEDKDQAEEADLGQASNVPE